MPVLSGIIQHFSAPPPLLCNVCCIIYDPQAGFLVGTPKTLFMNSPTPYVCAVEGSAFLGLLYRGGDPDEFLAQHLFACLSCGLIAAPR